MPEIRHTYIHCNMGNVLQTSWIVDNAVLQTRRAVASSTTWRPSTVCAGPIPSSWGVTRSSSTLTRSCFPTTRSGKESSLRSPRWSQLVCPKRMVTRLWSRPYSQCQCQKLSIEWHSSACFEWIIKQEMSLFVSEHFNASVNMFA